MLNLDRFVNMKNGSFSSISADWIGIVLLVAWHVVSLQLAIRPVSLIVNLVV